MIQNRSLPSARWLIVSQGLNALGDHAAKITVSSLIAASFVERQASIWVGVVSALYVVPYIVLAPLAGRLTQGRSKRAVVRGCLALQTVAMLGIALAAGLGSFPLVMLGLSLVAMQSTLLAPARNALLKDLSGSDRIGQMMGLMGMVGVGATLAGLAAGGWSFDWIWEKLGSSWTASAWVAGVAAAFSAVAFVVTGRIRKSEEKLSSAAGSFRGALKELGQNRSLRWSSFGLAWFYGVGAMLVMILLQDARWEHGQESGTASQGGSLAALLGLGVAVGSGLAAAFCRRRVEVGVAAVGAVLLALATPFTALVWGSFVWGSLGIFLMGVAGGLFSAPLNGLFLSKAGDTNRVSLIAANNLVINLCSAALVGAASAMAFAGWSPQVQLWLVSASCVGTLLMVLWVTPESLGRVIALSITRFVYPARISGEERMPEAGGVLIVSNHVSYIDALLVYLSSPRPVRFVGTDEMLRFRFMRWVYRKFNVIPVSPTKAKDAIQKTVDALRAGDVVCLFPEGALTRTGMVMPFKKGASLIARRAGAMVQPVALDGIWGSVFSFADKPFRYRIGMPLRRPVRILYGNPISPAEASAEAMRDAVMGLQAEAFGRRERLDEPLAKSALRALRRSLFRPMLIDRCGTRAEYSGLSLALASTGFARIVRRETMQTRVAVMLPPGVAGFAANIGSLWAGRAVVNLNPTLGPAAFAETLEASGVDCLLTSKALLARFPNLRLDGCRVLFVEDLRSQLRDVKTLVSAFAILALPHSLLCRFGLFQGRGGVSEAFLMFSSGSSATPKAIPLSHRNVQANALQLSECYLLRSTDSVLSNLPLFHSFGLTGGLWLPLMKGIRIVATASPLLVKENIDAVREEQATVMLGTPTFLKPYLLKATTEDFQSLRLCMAGAEKLPEALSSAWQERFASPLLEGYGLTECAPVVAANCLHSREMLGRYALNQSGYKAGTVGRPLPGVWVRIVREDKPTELVEEGESGLLLVKGANVFAGYLSGDDAGQRDGSGWFNTGDIARFDGEGCLKIEGRKSRFSKIGGEMVSHGAVEQAILQAYPEIGEEASIFVGGRTCTRKGEMLVLLSSIAFDVQELASRLRAKGLSNLAIPRELVKIETLPLLGTGKLDLKRCMSWCAEGLQPA